MASRVAVSALGTGTTTISIVFTGAQPQPGNKVAVAFSSLFSSTPGVSSVTDNAGQTYTEANDGTTSGHTIIGGVLGTWLYFVDLPASAVWSGSYTVTVTFTGGTITHSAGAAVAYSGAATGQAGLCHHAQDSTGSSTAVASGSISPSGTGLYVGTFGDAATTDPSTVTQGGNLAEQVASQHGSTTVVCAISDFPEGSGSQQALWTIDASDWTSVIAFWPDAPTVAETPQPTLLVAVATEDAAFPGSWPGYNNYAPAASIVAPLGQQASSGSVSVTPANDAVPPPLALVQLTLPTLNKAFIDSAALAMLWRVKTLLLVVDTILHWASSGQATWQPFAAEATFTAVAGSSSGLTASQVLIGSAQNLGGGAATSLAAGLYRVSPAAIAELQWPDAFLGVELQFPSAITSGAARLFVVGG